MHTHYSDGTIEPVELVRKASKTGVEAIAITDHDNFRAYSVAKNEAEKLGLQLVFGSEVTAEKYHILGLGAKLNNPEFIRFLEYSRKLQMNNTRRTVANLQKVGLDVNFEEVENYTPVGARVGCFNVSLYLANNEKFKDYFLQKGINFDICGVARFVKKYKYEEESATPLEVIRAIKRNGGVAIIAHPAKDIGNFLDKSHVRELKSLLDLGLDGVEIQPNKMELGYQNYVDYAKKNNLLITYGSDYHQTAMSSRPILGRGFNQVSDEFVEKLL